MHLDCTNVQVIMLHSSGKRAIEVQAANEYALLNMYVQSPGFELQYENRYTHSPFLLFKRDHFNYRIIIFMPFASEMDHCCNIVVIIHICGSVQIQLLAHCLSRVLTFVMLHLIRYIGFNDFLELVSRYLCIFSFLCNIPCCKLL